MKIADIISNDLSLVHAVLAEPTQRVGAGDVLIDKVIFFHEVSRLTVILLPSLQHLGKLSREKVQINSVSLWVVLVSDGLVEQLSEEVDVEHVSDPGASNDNIDN